MTRPLLLDLFCGAGGAAMGYYRAGFDVVGVDIKPMPRYPFPFILGDALDVMARMLKGEKFLASDGKWYGIEDFDAIHASPPCHFYSTGTQHRKNQGVVYPALIEPIRNLLLDTGLPFIIENVPGAIRALRSTIMLCGSMFGIGVMRHRWFETSFLILSPGHVCNNNEIDRDALSVTRHGPPARWYSNNPGASFNIKMWHDAMEIDWMSRNELTQAIPPAYTEYIGGYLLKAIQP